MPPLVTRVCAIVVVAVCGASCAARLAPAVPVETRAGVRFVVARPEARSVALAGTFNEWSIASHPLARDTAGGPWTIVVRLPPGEHLFMYVVDGGEWVTPPHAADFADDGFGARNGIVVVPPKER